MLKWLRSGLQERHLRLKIVAERDDKILRRHAVLLQRDGLLVGFRRVLRPAADGDKGVEFGLCSEDVVHLLRGQFDIVVVVDRATVGLGPTILPGQTFDGWSFGTPASVSRIP